MDEPENYEFIKNSAAEKYASFGKVACPAFNNEFVHFTSEGFKHLLYKRDKKRRNKKDQVARFLLLDKAKCLLDVSNTFQEYEESYEYTWVINRGKNIQKNVLVRYWGLVGIIDGCRIKVVVKQIGNGKKEFYSVIPAWFSKYYRGTKIIYNSPPEGIFSEDNL